MAQADHVFSAIRALIAGASASPSTNPVLSAYAEFVSFLAGSPPGLIPTDADGADLEDRADHLHKVFKALSHYLTEILDDTSQNAPGRLDLPDVEAVLADLAADVTGSLQNAADFMAGRGE